MEGILRRVARCKFRSLIDGQDAYEQIRVVPEHVPRAAVSTPDGNMVSLVLQQGDCNTPATYQSLMNYLFSEFIGRWIDVYLDDIIIYSNTLEEHIKHVKIVIDILKREQLYLSANKMQLLKAELNVLMWLLSPRSHRRSRQIPRQGLCKLHLTRLYTVNKSATLNNHGLLGSWTRSAPFFFWLILALMNDEDL